MLTIATANVNGIRAAYRRGMGEWLESRRPDVLLLQEVRAPEELVDGFLPSPRWRVAQQVCDIKGRAGVAVASRLPVGAVRVGLDQGVPVNTGRWVEAELELPDGDVLTVVSTYIHSGTAGTPKMDEKYVFLDLVTDRLAELRAAGGKVLVAGDVNIAHREVDIKNWKGNLRSAGFLPEERAYLDRWFDAGWVDVGRRLGGEGPGPYTWWSWRGQAFANDSGWRIDYQIVSPELAAHAVKAEVDRAATYEERWSDHAPLVVTYDL
ncbi:exodeoxyribonuclease III [Cellulomonas bogoriensis]|uniref:Exodeoxyribonuclease III n=1 Tax=Cellulomonas bogoriensis 69B4 = DSM 16987 TaxID=1386082 RepID=A0A0A0C1C7_9CELL|nr:exodeoxyribonuclease III [Cellulomonas bogoriensis]KGM14000.1 exodeoxyribonuclease III [Cellulomonas bogoriensis 69B4 = DSM 16987]